MTQGEAELREKRVRAHAFHLKKAHDRLRKMDEYFPGRTPRPFDYDFDALDREVARLDAKPVP